jgi:hypothetical protein
VASPGSEAAVRRLIGELRLGKPNYDLMSSEMARETRRQLTQEQATIAKGALDWRTWLNLDGSVDVFFVRAVSLSK